jgi:hypothetical protein
MPIYRVNLELGCATFRTFSGEKPAHDPQGEEIVTRCPPGKGGFWGGGEEEAESSLLSKRAHHGTSVGNWQRFVSCSNFCVMQNVSDIKKLATTILRPPRRTDLEPG